MYEEIIDLKSDLEAKEFERVGGTQTMKSRFLLAAASNRNIEELVEQGAYFRSLRNFMVDTGTIEPCDGQT